MAKFAARQTNLHAPVVTTADRTVTHEGGDAYSRDAKSDLFLLAVTNMVSEDTFYESGKARDARFEQLIRQVTAEDPDWMARFVPFLRSEMLMRSASVVAAIEYAKAGGPHPRAVVSGALQRPDEPGEALAYLFSRHGRKLSGGVQRGIADAATRLYNERAALRYDGTDRPWRMADVIELTHPTPAGPWQSALFRYLLDKRHHGDLGHGDTAPIGSLSTIMADIELRALPEGMRRAALDSDLWREAGWSWERLSGWLPGGMDAAAWEAVIPTMGVLALIRNLRNFDKAGISAAAVDAVIAKITDADQVIRSRIFPYQVWAAYREAPSDNWQRALGTTLDLTVRNVPQLDGGTLIAIDTSGSMQTAVSGRSKMARVEVAAVMGMILAKRSDADVVIFGNSSAPINRPAGASTLRGVETIVGAVGMVGHGTYGHTALAQHWNPARHRRAIIVTDDQMHDSGRVDLSHIPTILTFNLAGYAPAALPAGEHGRYVFGGFSDAGFRLLPLLDAGKDGRWPF